MECGEASASELRLETKPCGQASRGAAVTSEMSGECWGIEAGIVARNLLKEVRLRHREKEHRETGRPRSGRREFGAAGGDTNLLSGAEAAGFGHAQL